MSKMTAMRLFDALGEIDEAFVAGALEVSDRAALLRYAGAKKRAAGERGVFVGVPRRASRLLGAAAALLLSIAVALALPRLLSPTPPVTPPTPSETVTIDTVDELNYYAAMRVLGNVAPAAAPAILGAWQVYPRVTPMSAPVGGAGRVVYDMTEMAEDGSFTVTDVLYFRIEITAGCFLAEKVGVGIAEVVVTHNSIEPMITVKNGDRYYSCCRNECAPDREVFSTHKFTSGTQIVKDFDAEGRCFTVSYDGWHPEHPEYLTALALSLTCASPRGEETEHVMPVLGATYVAQVNESFTVSMLEDYFNGGETAK